MTQAEDEALSIFVYLVAEFLDAELLAQQLIGNSDAADNLIGYQMSGLLDTLRAGYTQEYLNGLAATIIHQEDPQNA